MERPISSQNDPPAADRPYDDIVRDLEACARELEEGRLPLERAIERFKEGMELARLAERRLQAAEGQVNLLLKAEDGTETVEPLHLGTEEAPRGPRLATSAPAGRPAKPKAAPGGDDIPF